MRGCFLDILARGLLLRIMMPDEDEGRRRELLADDIYRSGVTYIIETYQVRRRADEPR